MQSILLEILGERDFCLSKEVFPGMRANVMSFLQSRESKEVTPEKKIHSAARYVSGKRVTDSASLLKFRLYNGDDLDDDDDDDDDYHDDDRREVNEKKKTINIVRLTGPMTRGGGACTYGSLEIRNILMSEADKKDVVAHIIYTRTPGGMASTLIDFRKAIDYIHERGQKIYMFCDGTVASGGAFLSAMCDGVYAFNGEDEIGSIGMYSAFFTMKDGDVNSITQETYHEYYAEKSPDKNKILRDTASGDMDSLKEHTNKYLDELLNNLQKDRPSITEEQQSGSMYKMKDVVGTMIDGICSLEELCDMAFQEWSQSQAAQPQPQPDNNNPNNNQTMSKSKEYQHIAAACGEAPYVSDNDGILSLQAEQADVLESRLPGLLESEEKLSNENAQLKEEQVKLASMIASISTERDELKASVSSLQEKLTVNLEETFAEERTQLQEEINSLKSTVESLQTAQDDLKAQIETLDKEKSDLNTSLSEKEQIISDLNEKLEQANSGSSFVSGEGGSPKKNGEASGAMKMTSAPVWDNTKSPSENTAIMNAYLEEQRKKAMQ